MGNSNQKIELVPAYLFTCDNCGEENVVGIPLIETDTDCYVLKPEVVQCPNCRTEYEADYVDES